MRSYYRNAIQEILSRSLTPSDFTLQSYDSAIDLLPKDYAKLNHIKYKFYDLIKTIFNKYTYINFYQKLINDFDESEIVDLDQAIAKLIIPRLKIYQKYIAPGQGIPLYGVTIIEITEASWKIIVDEMIWAFEFSIFEYNDLCDDWAWVRYHNGMNLFAKYFKSLWL